MRDKEYSRKSKLKSKRLAPANYLIVCEGKQTEPNYFNGLKKKINEKYGNKVDVLIPNIEVKGTGKNTTDLVNYTDKFVNYSNKRYGQIWVVFDKDDYPDKQFNQAIKNSSFNIAWSNPCFEIWILLHLKKVINFVPKDKILNELDKEFKKYGLGNYRKNDKNIFKKISKDDNLNKAITNAKKLNDKFKDEEPSKSNPMTTVYKIVEDLKEYL